LKVAFNTIKQTNKQTENVIAINIEHSPIGLVWLKLVSCMLVTRIIPDVSSEVEAFGTGQ
jgi:hypothetical protein